MRILLLEDEKNIRESIKLNLELEDYEVVDTDEGKEALRIVAKQHFDLAVIDIMLPDISGLDVCERIKIQHPEIPIVIISAKDTSQDRIQGLKKGADDYLNKPFDIEELLLRIKKIISRVGGKKTKEETSLVLSGYTINYDTYQAISDDKTISLTHKECLLLKLLHERQNEVVSRNEILKAVWGYEVYPSTRTIDNFILALRKYFEEDPKNPKYFKSIRSVGYKLVLD